ncbi:hypothetical protein A2397_00030 [Candidatus Amesbacteria bacterium RIFOXYB1_FULL_44_23]|uniref:Uncharacterized protein n=1 Tax=Candidatus Amesbacteria bacterium RIFOXYB1_FULL_44_23 TaxID=1797263 RepID=A0A1F4ZT70_9BACT|nr:MAG: hypothetical protein A2397_00030 [Candidatus Amesbacteria bacterium RIFOXYB1_FULL_44_23]
MKQNEAEARLIKAEQTRNNLASIVCLGWIAAIRQSQQIFDDPQVSLETRSKAGLIMLVAGEDWAFRAGYQRRKILNRQLIEPLYRWFDESTQGPEDVLQEVEMERMKKRIRDGEPGIKEELEVWTDSSQKAVLWARLALRENNVSMMQRAVTLQQQYDNPDRLAVLKRWQSEMANPGKIKVKELVTKIVYGVVAEIIPWGLLGIKDLSK